MSSKQSDSVEQRSVSEHTGEPVAECVDDGEGGVYYKTLAAKAVLGKLYATPQQRKPLTFYQVEDCFPERPSVFVDVYGDHQTSPRWLHDFAKAIEAAHGIKE